MINGFDTEAYLACNQDINTKKLDIKTHLEENGLQDIATSKRMFHKDFQPFNEALYLKKFKDIKQVIENDGALNSGFEHFCHFGYSEIIRRTRKWPLVDTTEDSLLFEHVKKHCKVEDLFAAYVLIENIDEAKYLDANPDVRESITSSPDSSTAIDHLLHHGVRDIFLGHRVPYPDADLKADIPAFVDWSIVTSDNTLYIEGWCFTLKGKIKSIYLSNGKKGIDITETLLHYPRKDLEPSAGKQFREAGFYGYLETDLIDASRFSTYFLVIQTDTLVKSIPFTPEDTDDTKETSKVILEHLQVDNNLMENFDTLYGVALKSYLERNKPVIEYDSVDVSYFGEPVKDPKVSVIVPLYGRIDFVEVQLSQFANDPFFKETAELIYVLDDPKMKQQLNALCHTCYPVFEVPFKVVNAHKNYGYAIANNIGAKYATAPLLLLMNSDILPLDKVWLNDLLTEYNTQKSVGVICPKLVFEDGAIQHAGMVFQRNEALNMWLNEHPGKGLPDMSGEIETKTMPAVTGACMLIDSELYHEVGGMSDNYFLGDFEDSDLCLKLHKKGYINYYTPSVKLCHLERQSQSLFSDTSWKGKITLFNAWQHERKWSGTINEVMREYNAR